MIIVRCVSCGTKFPVIVGEPTPCPNCGKLVFVERKINYALSDYNKMKEEYEIRYEIRKYIRDHPEKSKKEIIQDLASLLEKKGFDTKIIEEEIGQ